jgi:hypothetical protein
MQEYCISEENGNFSATKEPYIIIIIMLLQSRFPNERDLSKTNKPFKGGKGFERH